MEILVLALLLALLFLAALGATHSVFMRKSVAKVKEEESGPVASPARFACLVHKAQWPNLDAGRFDVIFLFPLWAVHWLPIFRREKAES